jgi:serine/threonine-protein kinase
VTQGGSNLAAGVREGDVLAGKYRVEKVLGAGGMGVVVAARHIQLDTKVALKFLLPAMLGNREAVSRFAREARAAVKITSEHVARVLDVGTLENGAPYLVMEYLEGGDLDGWIKQRGALPIEQAVEFVLQACVAVADAHGLGIVHRDLKPANLFCVRRSDGQLIVKVLDFGISKMTDLSGSDSGMSMTRTSSVLGSPLYMSPEQMQTPKDVDATTDIWALGVILYELLTARVPFDGETIAVVAVKAATQPPPPMRTYRPDVPPGLEGVIVRCLAKDRRNRYRNVAELAVALVEFAPRRARASVERISGIIQASGLSASALAMPPSPPVVGTLLAPGTVAPVGRTAVSQAPGGGRKNRLLAASLGAVAVVCTVAVVAFVGRTPHAPPPPAQAGPPEPVHVATVAVVGPPPPSQVILPPAEALPGAAPPLPSTPLASAATAPRDSRTAHPRIVPTVASTSSVSVTPPAAPSPPSPPPAAPPVAQVPTATPSFDPLSKLRVK